MNSLTWAEAISRKNCISDNVRYTLYLYMKEDKYRGGCQIEFELRHLEDLFLDFQGSQIIFLQINSIEVPKDEFKALWVANKLHLSHQLLVLGKNSVIVRFQSIYRNDRMGLLSIKYQNGDQIMYTQNVPYYLNFIFPIFDQPDIKGVFRLRILTQKHWEVYSNESVIDSLDGFQQE